MSEYEYTGWYYGVSEYEYENDIAFCVSKKIDEITKLKQENEKLRSLLFSAIEIANSDFDFDNLADWENRVKQILNK